MSPDEMNAYKADWLEAATSVNVIPEMDVEGKKWCRSRLERHQWSFEPGEKYHTFKFEKPVFAQNFAQEFIDQVVK
jgi:hypothetical protein